MNERTKGKVTAIVPTLLVAAGFIPLATALIDLVQGEGLSWVAVATGFLLIAAGLAMRAKRNAAR